VRGRECFSRAAGTLILFLAAACFSAGATGEKAPADLVLRGAAVVTLEPGAERASALAVRDGKIVVVGSSADVAPFIGEKTRILDLPGGLVLPGFHDSHVHPVTGGMELLQCDLNGLPSKEVVFERIRAYAAEHPDLDWIAGGGWDLPHFPGGDPSRADLDRLVGDRPAYLSSSDGHSAWVSTRALALAGLDAATLDPPSGRIEREEGTRFPSGTLRESAMDLVARHLPEPGPEDYLEGARQGLALARRFGITSLHEASANESILAAYAGLEERGELTARVTVSMRIDPGDEESRVDEIIALSKRYASDRLRVTGAKLFADGVIEAHTAWLFEPYVDRPGSRGEPVFSPDALRDWITRLDKKGLQVHVHAIGDAAVRGTLDAMEAARRKNGPGPRHQIAHLELVDPADFPRFRELGVAADFQALWAYADSYITELTEPVLGPERSRWLYPIASVVKAGAPLVAGSDWSVTSMNPLDAIQVAMTREPLAGTEKGPWIPEERVDVETMLTAYTSSGAWLFGAEDRRGTLTVGKDADLVVLDRDLFDIPAREIHEAKVLLTVVEGQVVHEDESLAAAPEQGRRRSVLFCLIDTCRADRLGFLRGDRDTTPFLTRLAERSVVFENCTSQAPWTQPSMAAILSSRHPGSTGVFRLFQRLDSDFITFPEVLQEAGYETLGFSSNPIMGVISNYTQGFDAFVESIMVNRADPIRFASGSAKKLNDKIFPWLDRTAHWPMLLYVHSVDPHEEYEPAPDFLARFADPEGMDRYRKDWQALLGTRPGVPGNHLTPANFEKAGIPPGPFIAHGKDLYDADLLANDHELERLFAKLEEDGWGEDLVFVLTSDHGEEFFEHGGTSHGYSLYQELLHVPLLIHAPGLLPGGKRIRERVRSIDIYPTLLDLLGIEIPEGLEGRSLLPLVQDHSTWEQQPIFSEITEDERARLAGSGSGTAVSVIKGRWKLIRSFLAPTSRQRETYELFDLEADPGETVNLAVTHPDLVRELEAEILAYREKRLGKAADDAGEIDEETLEQLRKLGYIK